MICTDNTKMIFGKIICIFSISSYLYFNNIFNYYGICAFFYFLRFFEIVVMLVKQTMTGALGILEPGTPVQVGLAVLIMFIYLMVLLKFRYTFIFFLFEHFLSLSQHCLTRPLLHCFVYLH